MEGVEPDEIDWSGPRCGTRVVRAYRAVLDAGELPVTRANTIIYRTNRNDCLFCALKAQRCPNVTFRNIVRGAHEGARDLEGRIATTPKCARCCHERRKVEMLFAHLKLILKVDRLRLRGMSGAKEEFLLAATAQNLRKLSRLITQQPPVDSASAPV